MLARNVCVETADAPASQSTRLSVHTQGGNDAGAQPAPKDEAYWQAYIAAVRPGSIVKVRLHDESRFEGRLLATTADDMVIHVKRLPFRRRLERRVRFDAIESLSGTHPIRDFVLSVAVTVGVSAVLLAALYSSGS